MAHLGMWLSLRHLDTVATLVPVSSQNESRVILDLSISESNSHCSVVVRFLIVRSASMGTSPRSIHLCIVLRHVPVIRLNWVIEIFRVRNSSLKLSAGVHSFMIGH